MAAGSSAADARALLPSGEGRDVRPPLSPTASPLLLLLRERLLFCFHSFLPLPPMAETRMSPAAGVLP